MHFRKFRSSVCVTLLSLICTGCIGNSSSSATTNVLCNADRLNHFEQQRSLLKIVKVADYKNVQEVELFLESDDTIRFVKVNSIGEMSKGETIALLCSNKIKWIQHNLTTYSMPLTLLEETGKNPDQDKTISRILFGFDGNESEILEIMGEDYTDIDQTPFAHQLFDRVEELIQSLE